MDTFKELFDEIPDGQSIQFTFERRCYSSSIDGINFLSKPFRLIVYLSPIQSVEIFKNFGLDIIFSKRITSVTYLSEYYSSYKNTMKDQLHLYLSDPNSKVHVLNLGVNDDSGCANFLNSISHNQVSSNLLRIVVKLINGLYSF